VRSIPPDAPLSRINCQRPLKGLESRITVRESPEIKVQREVGVVSERQVVQMEILLEACDDVVTLAVVQVGNRRVRAPADIAVKCSFAVADCDGIDKRPTLQDPFRKRCGIRTAHQHSASTGGRSLSQRERGSIRHDIAADTHDWRVESAAKLFNPRNFSVKEFDLNCGVSRSCRRCEACEIKGRIHPSAW
jgi:hypothetical protein